MVKQTPTATPLTPQQYKPKKGVPATPQKGKPTIPQSPKTPSTLKISLPQEEIDLEQGPNPRLPLVTFQQTDFYKKDNFARFKGFLNNIPFAKEHYFKYVDLIIQDHPNLNRGHSFFHSKYFWEWMFTWQGTAFLKTLNPDDSCCIHKHSNHTNTECNSLEVVDPDCTCVLHGNGHLNEDCHHQLWDFSKN